MALQHSSDTELGILISPSGPFIENHGSKVLSAEEVSEADKRNAKFMKHEWRSPRRGEHVSFASTDDELSTDEELSDDTGIADQGSL